MTKKLIDLVCVRNCYT